MKLEDARTMLIVEDEASVLRSIKGYFEDLDYQVYGADNGRSGLELFHAKHPQTVLADLHMPEVSGLEMLHEVRKASPETPVLVISGSGVMSDVVEALRLGAWDYLIKPIVDLSVLAHAVDRSRERSRLLRENRLHHECLEEEVKRRTAELEAANQSLESKNLTLREVLAAIEADKKEVGQRVVSSVEKMVLPMLQTLRRGVHGPHVRVLNQIEQSLREITSPFVDKLAKDVASLSPTEVRISSLIRRGLSVKEIADLESISTETVGAHRRNIRRKLGITNTKVNLATYLEQAFGGKAGI